MSRYNYETAEYEYIEHAVGGPAKKNFSLLIRNEILKPNIEYFVQLTVHWN